MINWSNSIDKRFWSKVDIKSYNECWNWQASTDSYNYGHFWHNNKLRTSTRVAYELFYDCILEDKKICVCHHCDNPLCVNPTHLFLASQLENIRDKVKKGRQYFYKERGLLSKRIILGLPTKSLNERFWEKVKKTSTCWLWKASVNTQGYGQIMIDKKPRGSHRVSWELAHGSIPNNLWVLHKCDNPPCVNPDHLYLGTAKDNADDMISRNRQNNVRPKNPAIGSRHGRSKLIESEVIEIRNRYKTKNISQRKLAKEFNISQAAILSIIHRRGWRHI